MAERCGALRGASATSAESQSGKKRPLTPSLDVRGLPALQRLTKGEDMETYQLIITGKGIEIKTEPLTKKQKNAIIKIYGRLKGISIQEIDNDNVKSLADQFVYFPLRKYKKRLDKKKNPCNNEEKNMEDLENAETKNYETGKGEIRSL